MGTSALCAFKKCGRGRSAFCYHLCTHCKEIDEPVIYCEFRDGEISLSSFIHEVNECELVNLLIKKFGQPKQQTLKFDKTHKKKYKGIINLTRHSPKKVLVSHIVSPYGCCGCIFPNYKNKAYW